jgi:hypothetical protein
MTSTPRDVMLAEDQQAFVKVMCAYSLTAKKKVFVFDAISFIANPATDTFRMRGQPMRSGQRTRWLMTKTMMLLALRGGLLKCRKRRWFFLCRHSAWTGLPCK